MAFVLKKKGAATASSDSPASSSNAPKAKGFLKTGAEGLALMHKAEAEHAAKKTKQGKAYRFWMKEGTDRTITFLDGQIDKETGILKIPYQNEHRIKIGGEWEDIICTQDTEGSCPLCDAGEKRAFVGYLSIIDHQEYKDKDGNVHEAQRRLYVPKSETLKQLTKLAEKNGPRGLCGVTYEVSRTGDKKPNVGDMFELQQENSSADLEQAFGDMAKPLDYESELTYLTPAQMEEMGIGKKVATIGSKSSGGAKFGAKKSTEDSVDTDDVPW